MTVAAVIAGVKAYYEVHNSTKIGDVDGLVPRYEGRYAVLLSALEASALEL